MDAAFGFLFILDADGLRPPSGAFALTGPTISHHLKVLREAGLVDSDRRGTWVYYRLVPAALALLAGLLDVSTVTAGV